jgi:hypothetical protein
MNLDADDGIDLITTAIEKQSEEKAWQIWLTRYPFVEIQWLKFIPFSEFYKAQTVPQKIETKEEILEKVFDIIRIGLNGK